MQRRGACSLPLDCCRKRSWDCQPTRLGTVQACQGVCFEIMNRRGWHWKDLPNGRRRGSPSTRLLIHDLSHWRHMRIYSMAWALVHPFLIMLASDGPGIGWWQRFPVWLALHPCHWCDLSSLLFPLKPVSSCFPSTGSPGGGWRWKPRCACCPSLHSHC